MYNLQRECSIKCVRFFSGINLERAMAGGVPKRREVETFYDLEDADLPMYFVGYDK